MRMTRPIVAAVALALLAAAGPTSAQSVATRTPNLLGGWTAPVGVIQFNFLHRFSVTDAPLRKILNTPTFNVGTGLSDHLMLGFVYGSNSVLVPAYPNEWEFYTRVVPLRQSRGAPIDVSIQGGYNIASESVDGEVLLSRDFGRFRLLGAGRAFSEAYDGTEARFAFMGGAVLELTSSISIAGDYGALLDREDVEEAAWGAGLQLGVPFTPHSFSLHASNVGTASLEGASRGTRTRWGFEYTIPVSVRRYLPRGERGDEEVTTREPAGAQVEEAMPTAAADTVVVEIQNLAYGTEVIEIAPGTTVLWRNLDPVQHTVTADDESFDSGLIGPEESYTRKFNEVGTFPFHCIPHPFMTGRVVVQEMSRADRSGGHAEESNR